MPDEKKTYLINIESNLKKYTDEAAEAKKKVDELKAANDALKKSGKENTAEYQVNNAELKNAQKEYNNLKKVIEAQLTVLKQESTYREKLVATKTIEIAKLKELGNGYIKNAEGLNIINPKYIETTKRIGDINKAIIDNDLSMNSGATNVGRYGETVKSAFGNIGKSILSFIGISGGIAGVFELGKKVIDSTQKSAAEFKAQIEGISTATNVFFQMLNSGEFSLNKLAAAYKAGKEYASALKELEERRLGLSLRQTEEDAKQTELIRQAGDNDLTAIERQKALNGYKLKATELGNTALKIEDDAVADKEKELEGLGIEAKQLKEFYESYGSNVELIRKVEEKVNTILDARAEINSRKITPATIQNLAQIEKYQKIYDDTFASMNDNEKHYFELVSTNDKARKKDVTDYIELLITQAKKKDEIAEINKETQRVQNSINTANKSAIREESKGWEEVYKMRIDLAKVEAELHREMQKHAKDVHDSMMKGVSGTLNPEAIIRETQRGMMESLKAEYDASYKNAFAQIDIKKNMFEIERRMALEEALRTGADVHKINAKYNAEEVKLENEKNQLKLSLAAGFFGNMSIIFGKQSAVGKAAAVVETTINTYAAATAAYKAMAGIPVVGPALGIAAAAAAIAAGLENVKNILAVDTSGKVTTSSPSAISSAPATQRTYAISTGSSVLNQPALSQAQLNTLPNQNLLTASDIAAALKNLPAPVVTVEDINAKVKAVQKVTVRANI